LQGPARFREETMNTRNLLAGTAILSVLAFGAGAIAAPADQPGHQSPAPGTNNNAVSAVKDATGHAVGTVSAEMTSTAQGFVDAAATSDMYEVEAGRIALQRSQSADVKAFAQKMIDAHTATTAELKSDLASGNIAVTPPAHLDDRRQGLIDDLRGAKAVDFDSRYISQQVDAHNEVAIVFRGYARGGDNAALKKFAAKTLPDIEHHLAMANKLSTEISRAK
jgi:putative membrane protein